jgi:uncharacterized low-complexity protein
MLKKTDRKLIATAAMAGALTLGVTVQAAENPFAMTDLGRGYVVADNQTKMPEGKCGEGKCGTKTKDEKKDPAKDAKKDKTMEGKCGEGKCGSDKK